MEVDKVRKTLERDLELEQGDDYILDLRSIKKSVNFKI
jgi:hypothetical protein